MLQRLSMRKDDLVRMQHMLDAAKEAISFAWSRTRADLDSDRMLTLSIMKAIEIVGEAASKASKECRDRFTEIPWSNIVGVRNRLIHVYFDINLDRLWDTVTDDLPPLAATLERIISQEGETQHTP